MVIQHVISSPNNSVIGLSSVKKLSFTVTGENKYYSAEPSGLLVNF